MKVSIIMPVFNAAANLPRSLESIKAQTWRDFEMVFVDDCSTDGTGSILKDFADNSGIACKVVERERNGGVASARNAGLDAAGGEYVMWVDSDDTLVPDALRTALESGDGADIIGWDWILGFERNGRHMRQADWSVPLEALKALMGGTMRWNLWLFMTRRSLLADNAIRFIDGANMGEDMMFMLKAFCSAGSAVRIQAPLYCYNAVNSGSISRQFSELRRNEVSANVKEVERYIASSSYAGELREYVNYLKLYIKLPLLLSPDSSDFDIWYSWWPDANPYAAANRALPFRTRALQWMAARRMRFCVRLYYVLVYKFVYGIVYR